MCLRYRLNIATTNMMINNQQIVLTITNMYAQLKYSKWLVVARNMVKQELISMNVPIIGVMTIGQPY